MHGRRTTLAANVGVMTDALRCKPGRQERRASSARDDLLKPPGHTEKPAFMVGFFYCHGRISKLYGNFTMTTSAQQSHSVDVLVERVTRLVDDVEGLRDDIRNQTAVIGRIPVIEHELVNLDKKVAGAFKAIDEAEQETVLNTHSIIQARTMYKVLTAMSGIAVTVTIMTVGWAWSQLTTLKESDQAFNVRLVTMEVRSLTNAQNVQNLQNAAPQKDAEKLDKGWTRGKN